MINSCLAKWTLRSALHAILACLLCGACSAQMFIRPGIANTRDIPVVEVQGASVKTNPDLQALLDEALRAVKDKNYRIAVKFLDKVLEASGDSLTASDANKTIFSMNDHVEKLIAELPADALGIYRITADATAREILNSPGDEVTRLTQITTFYFASSLGDDAALRLGSIYLDRYDFPGALRVLNKIVDVHPDPSVEMDKVHASIAICHAFMGDPERATEAIRAGSAIDSDSSSIRIVKGTVKDLQLESTESSALAEWKMPLGDDSRLAAMPSLPASAYNVDQACIFQYYVEPIKSFIKRPDTVGKILVGKDASKSGSAYTNKTEKEIIKAWRMGSHSTDNMSASQLKVAKHEEKEVWRPAGELLFDKKHIYFKAPGDLLAFDRSKIPVTAEDAGKLVKPHQIRDFCDWRSLWRNLFEVESNIRTFSTFGGGFGRRTTVKRPALDLTNKMLYFDDRIHHQMAIQGDHVYSVEGKLFDTRRSLKPPKTRRSSRDLAVRRTRSNFLTAYDAETGRMLWRLPRVSRAESPSYELAKYNKLDIEETVKKEEDDWLTDGGIMGAPLKFADILIVPVNLSGQIHLYGVDPKQEGKTLWTCFLTDDPETGAVANSPINMSIDGSDLLVSCGTGVVFLIDPSTGKVRFAKRYSRFGKPLMQRNSFRSNSPVDYDGWSSDSILANGREIICFCSDTKTINGIDRNTGEDIWQTALSPLGPKVDYIIGAWNRKLYLGGNHTVVAIDLDAQGYIAWGGQTHFGDNEISYGRGMVTPEGVFVPVGNSIWRFSLDGDKGRAKVLNQVEVSLGTEAPVGNLYSDGERIWVRGACRLYALAPKTWDTQSDPKNEQ